MRLRRVDTHRLRIVYKAIKIVKYPQNVSVKTCNTWVESDRTCSPVIPLLTKLLHKAQYNAVWTALREHSYVSTRPPASFILNMATQIYGKTLVQVLCPMPLSFES
jgi:hypothetical protein